MSYFEHQDEMQGRVNAAFNRAMDDWENRMPDEDEEEEEPLSCPFCGSTEWEKMYETEDKVYLGCSDCISENKDPYWDEESQKQLNDNSIDNVFFTRICDCIDRDEFAGFWEKEQVKEILYDFVYEYRDKVTKRRTQKMKITEETRLKAYEEVPKQKRYNEIVEVLAESKDGLTAKECAYAMYCKKYIPSSERNFTAPRLNELVKKGTVRIVGKKKCSWTDRTVSVFALVG